MDFEKLGIIMKEQRKKAGLTQEELSVRCGMSMNTVSAVERGFVDVKLSTIDTIARAMCQPLVVFARYYNEPDPNDGMSVRRTKSNGAPHKHKDYTGIKSKKFSRNGYDRKRLVGDNKKPYYGNWNKKSLNPYSQNISTYYDYDYIFVKAIRNSNIRYSITNEV